MAKSDKRPQRVNLDTIAEDFGGRKPPQAIDVEEAVLGALLLEPEVVPEVLDQLQADCFYKDIHKKIFEAITTLSSRNDPVDIFSVSDELTKRGELEEVGGMAYLSQLST